MINDVAYEEWDENIEGWQEPTTLDYVKNVTKTEWEVMKKALEELRSHY